MNFKHLSILACACLLGTSSLRGQGTAISYNGHLSSGGAPASGFHDLRFILFNAEVGGSQVGIMLTNSTVGVSNGVFTTTLDFGPGIFDGTALWLELAVRPSGAAQPFDPLAPRQPMLPAPYAITAGNLTGTLSADQLTGTLPSSRLAGTYGNAVTFEHAGNSFTGDGAGLFALNAGNLETGTVPEARLPASVSLLGQTIEGSEIADGTITAADLDAITTSAAFWRATGNRGTDPSLNFLGSIDFRPFELRVNNTRAFRVQPMVNIGPNLVGGHHDNAVAPGFGGATIGGGGAPGFPNEVKQNFGTVGGGQDNIVSAQGATIGGGEGNRVAAGSIESAIAGGFQNQIANAQASFVGGGWSNDVRDGSPFSTIAGGFQNSVSNSSPSSVIGGGAGNEIADNSEQSTISGGWLNGIAGGAPRTTIGGGDNNHIGAGSVAAFIGGGSLNDIGSDADWGVIAGGRNNGIGADSFYGFIGGGTQNSIGAGSLYSSIVGGNQNRIAGIAEWSVIGAGRDNQIAVAADYASIAGGWNNVVGTNAQFSVIPGGRDNGVGTGASYAFAAGRRARANHQGSFVWADSTDADFETSAADQFRIRANGGAAFSFNGDHWIRFLHIPDGSLLFPASVITTSTGALLSEGGTWTDFSDRNGKENFAPTDSREVLSKLLGLPVTTWNYKAEGPRYRHMGPVAQDFYAAFGIGIDDKHLAALDANGVALAAIQGLNRKLEEQLAARDRTIDALLQRIDNLERSNAREVDGGVR
ncbi:MAG TPA: hypothetical protein DCY13_02220 [Verrucomicrobiales bacterium]|nr:hypothetical protein [Verrucomicrobiales bacterium]